MKKWNKYRRTQAAVLTVLAAAALAAGCGQRSVVQDMANPAGTDQADREASEAQKINGKQGKEELLNVVYDAQDLDSDWQEEAATLLECTGDTVEIKGDGASSEGAVITISQSGTYVLSGSLTEGQVRVDANREDVVRLVLNGFYITNSRTSPVYGIQCKKLILTLPEGTLSHVEDGSSYEYEEGQDEPDAPVFSNDDLTINGLGELTVQGNYNHGIRSKDDLVIVSGVINITAVNDGIKGKDSVAVKEASLVIEAGGDGIQSNHDTDASKGYILLEGGNYQIQAKEDGIQAETVLEITGGTYNLVSGGGSAQVPGDLEPSPGSLSGRQIGAEAGAEEVQAGSFKGLKAGTAIRVSDGELTLDCRDDAVHSNGSVQLDGGVFHIKTGDDGIHGDGNVSIESGVIKVTQSYEGIEGLSIDITGGEIQLVSSDDGLNAAGGNDSSGSFGGRDSFAANEDAYIRVAGGKVHIDALGDGIDSNGDFTVEGGEIYVSGPENSGNGILDYNGTALISGGTLIGTGSNGMLQTFSEESQQPVLVIYYDEEKPAGSQVVVSDTAGNELIQTAALKNFSVVIISTPELIQGETVSVKAGEEEQSLAINDTITWSGEAVGGEFDTRGFQERRGQRPGAGAERTDEDGHVIEGTPGGNETGKPPAQRGRVAPPDKNTGTDPEYESK